jgi:hypothetical protein
MPASCLSACTIKTPINLCSFKQIQKNQRCLAGEKGIEENRTVGFNYLNGKWIIQIDRSMIRLRGLKRDHKF